MRNNRVYAPHLEQFLGEQEPRLLMSSSAGRLVRAELLTFKDICDWIGKFLLRRSLSQEEALVYSELMLREQKELALRTSITAQRMGIQSLLEVPQFLANVAIWRRFGSSLPKEFLSMLLLQTILISGSCIDDLLALTECYCEMCPETGQQLFQCIGELQDRENREELTRKLTSGETETTLSSQTFLYDGLTDTVVRNVSSLMTLMERTFPSLTFSDLLTDTECMFQLRVALSIGDPDGSGLLPISIGGPGSALSTQPTSRGPLSNAEYLRLLSSE
jgi:hypothetical protein